MIYTANQPLLFPSIYMMNRYLHSEVLVVMEDAQFTKFGHQSRVEINTLQGLKYLTIPLKDRNFKPINRIEVDNPQRIVGQFQKTLQTVYGKTEGFKELRESLWVALDEAGHTELLSDFNMKLLGWLLIVLNIPTKVVVSTDILPDRPENPSEWVAALGEKVGASIYLGGSTAQQAYIKEEDFKSRGITLQPQNFKLTPYPSIQPKEEYFGKGSKDGWISILDPLFTIGVEETRKIIEVPPY